MNQPDNVQAPIPEGSERAINTSVEKKESVLPEAGPQKMGQAISSTVKSADPIPADISKALEPDAKKPVAQPSPGTVRPSVQKPSSEPYIKAAERVIEEDKGDPHKEEDDHEAIQMQYLSNRFGKNLKKK